MTSISLPFAPGFRIALVDESRLDDEVRRFRLYVVRFSKGRHVKSERFRRLQARLRPCRDARTVTRTERSRAGATTRHRTPAR
jgi:hypothetical protein